MPLSSIRSLVAVLAVFLCLAPAHAAPQPGADDLKATLTKLHKAWKTGDNAAAASISRGLLLTRDRIAKAVRDDAPPSVRDAIALFHEKALAANEDTAAHMLFPGADRTEIGVMASTTEELAKCAPGTDAAKHFPPASQDVAKAILRPGVTFYEVQFNRPGEPKGIKSHLFFWDGKAWGMLGPVWRFVGKK